MEKTIDKSALVTGGSAGIGLAVARALAEEGYDVTICGRDPEKLAAAEHSVPHLPGRLVGVQANLANDDAVDQLASAHLSRCGGIDVLVNNAGLGLMGQIADVPTKKLDLELSINFRSAFRLLQAWIPSLREAGERHGKALVVNVSSLVARLHPPNASVYAATKAALVSLSHSAHAELSQAGVQVTALTPGLVDTPGTSWADEQDSPEHAPPGGCRGGRPLPVAHVLALLRPRDRHDRCWAWHLPLTDRLDARRRLMLVM